MLCVRLLRICKETQIYNKMSLLRTKQNGCAPNDDSDQPGHPSNLIRICPQSVAKNPRFLYTDSEDLLDWANAQADLSLRLVHSHFAGFVMRWLKQVFPGN